LLIFNRWSWVLRCLQCYADIGDPISWESPNLAALMASSLLSPSTPLVLNAFKYPLLIGVGLSTVIGLLSCLIGYCSAHWCCKKEVQETRRERRRLMSMEMD
jgi:hypothetical protein